jgi:rhodanese-related sulfurtransferase
MFQHGYRVFRFLLAATALSAGVAACSPRDAGPEISAPEAYQRVQAGELTLVDIRRPDEWRQTGIAAGAKRLDMRHPGGPQGFANALLQEVDGNRDAPIGIICRTGNRTTQMQQALRDYGFTQVYNVREGMAGSAAGPGWIRQGLPVEPCVRC